MFRGVGTQNKKDFEKISSYSHLQSSSLKIGTPPPISPTTPTNNGEFFYINPLRVNKVIMSSKTSSGQYIPSTPPPPPIGTSKIIMEYDKDLLRPYMKPSMIGKINPLDPLELFTTTKMNGGSPIKTTTTTKQNYGSSYINPNLVPKFIPAGHINPIAYYHNYIDYPRRQHENELDEGKPWKKKLHEKCGFNETFDEFLARMNTRSDGSTIESDNFWLRSDEYSKPMSRSYYKKFKIHAEHDYNNFKIKQAQRVQNLFNKHQVLNEDKIIQMIENLADEKKEMKTLLPYLKQQWVPKKKKELLPSPSPHNKKTIVKPSIKPPPIKKNEKTSLEFLMPVKKNLELSISNIKITTLGGHPYLRKSNNKIKTSPPFQKLKTLTTTEFKLPPLKKKQYDDGVGSYIQIPLFREFEPHKISPHFYRYAPYDFRPEISDSIFKS